MDVQRDTSPHSAPLAFLTFMVLLAPVTNWGPHGVTLAGYSYAMRHGMKVQIVTSYHVSHLQRYGVTVHGNVTSVYPPLGPNIFSSTLFSNNLSLCSCQNVSRPSFRPMKKKILQFCTHMERGLGNFSTH
jgi:hypothetical protein